VSPARPFLPKKQDRQEEKPSPEKAAAEQPDRPVSVSVTLLLVHPLLNICR